MTLPRKLTAKHLWAITVGMVISGQYFGWNFGFAAGGLYGLIFATSIVTIFYLCLMFSYAELATSIPHAGGPSAYAKRAFGPLVGYISGIACLIEFIFAPPAIAVSIGSYLHFLFPFISAHIGTVLIFLFCLLINLTGTKNVAIFEIIVTVIALLGLSVYYAFGLPKLNFALLNPHHHFLSQGITGVFATIPFAMWLYLCIEGGTMTAEEVKDTHKDTFLGFISAIITLACCSFLTIFITAGLNPNVQYPTDAPLPQALAIAYHQPWLAYLVDTFGLFGLIASLNGIIIGYSRQVYALAREGFLPNWLSQLSKRHVPHYALIIPGVIGIVCAASADFSNSLIIIAVFAACISYCLSLLSLFKLRYSEKKLYRPFKVYFPLVPSIALLLGIVCLVSIYHYAIANHYLKLLTKNFPLTLVVTIIFIIMFLLLISKTLLKTSKR